MNSRRLQAEGEKVYVLVFERGDEVISILKEFALREDLGGSHFTAIGAFQWVLLGYLDQQRLEYQKISLDEQVEVLSLNGNITSDDDGPMVHAHVVVGCKDGMTRGGHLLEGRVWPTLELVLRETPVHLRRKTDTVTGLAMIQF